MEILMKPYLMLIAFLLLSLNAHGVTIYVPDDYGQIQTAIDASANGDLILIRPGTYFENIRYNGKLITLRSMAGPRVTVIDGSQAGSVVELLDYEGSDAVLDGFTITNGAADDGGGILSNSYALIINNIITRNTATGSGGGLGFVGLGIASVVNCKIHLNTAYRGGGIAAGGYTTPVVIHCTVYRNKALSLGGGGVLGGSHITNSIFWDNTAPDSPQLVYGYVNYCCVKGGVIGGIGNIATDPLFMDAESGDFHLTHASPCRNTGDSTYYDLPEFDCEGDPRISDGSVDMGADEFHRHLYWVGDAAPGGTVQGKLVGDPGETQVGLWFGSGVLDPPIPSAFGPWYLEFPLIGFFLLAPIPASGIEVLPAAVLPIGYPAPYDLPMQAIVGSALTNVSVIAVR
jgi:hypothetical protein